jgi:hypothetical protein
VAFGYLVFLLYGYFNKHTPPTVTSLHKVNYEKTAVSFDFPPISFEMHMPEGSNKNTD